MPRETSRHVDSAALHVRQRCAKERHKPAARQRRRRTKPPNRIAVAMPRRRRGCAVKRRRTAGHGTRQFSHAGTRALRFFCEPCNRRTAAAAAQKRAAARSMCGGVQRAQGRPEVGHLRHLGYRQNPSLRLQLNRHAAAVNRQRAASTPRRSQADGGATMRRPREPPRVAAGTPPPQTAERIRGCQPSAAPHLSRQVNLDTLRVLMAPAVHGGRRSPHATRCSASRKC